MEEQKRYISETFRELDFPIIVVSDEGNVMVVSRCAEALVPQLAGFDPGQSFTELMAYPPPSFAGWLEEARFTRTIRLCQEDGKQGAPLTVKSNRLGRNEPFNGYWVISFQQSQAFTKQKFEREILLRISSVPIPEMMEEGELLTSAEPGKSPITAELLKLVLTYLKGSAAMLFRLGESEQVTVTGQFGLLPEHLKPLLEHLEGSGESSRLYGGMVGSAANSGFPYTLRDGDITDEGLLALSGLLPFPCREIWLDGIGGFGAVATFFEHPPDYETRPFATDAFVRLGRHLESASYSNNMYEAYLELQQTQEQMIQSSKMAAIGELATGMAHELRQPVTVINNFFSTIFDHLEAGKSNKIQERLGEYKERFQRNIERLTRIIDHLRDFGRQESIQFYPTDIKSFLEEIFQTFLAAHLAKENITVRWEISDGMPKVDMDAPRIEQVVLNLISNAKDALEGMEGAVIVIRAETDGENIILSVRDNGPGIPEADLDKVLNPFFTTKSVGRGTGVGLSISHGIIKGHNGDIKIGNNPGGGAKFTINLPLKQPPPEKQKKSGPGKTAGKAE